MCETRICALLQPKLNKFVHDTCGVNNLHGMPGIIGALAGVLFAGIATYDYYGRSCALTTSTS